MTNLIYSQVYTAVAKYLLRLDREYPRNAEIRDPFYTIDIHQHLVNIAIYESKGFTKPVHFGLTPSVIADLWIERLQDRNLLAEAIAIVGAGKNRGPWEPIEALESMAMAVIHARLHWFWRHSNRYHETNDFYSVVGAFKARNPTPNLHLSPEDEALLDHVPSTKQMRLPV